MSLFGGDTLFLTTIFCKDTLYDTFGGDTLYFWDTLYTFADTLYVKILGHPVGGPEPPFYRLLSSTGLRPVTTLLGAFRHLGFASCDLIANSLGFALLVFVSKKKSKIPPNSADIYYFSTEIPTQVGTE